MTELIPFPFFSHNPMEACEQNTSRSAWASVMIFQSQIVAKLLMTWLTFLIKPIRNTDLGNKIWGYDFETK